MRVAHFEFPYAPIVTTLAMETTDLEIGYQRPLLPPINITLRYGEKSLFVGSTVLVNQPC